MAEPIVRKFVIDTTESEQNLKELNTQINATSTAVNQGAQSFENVAAAEQEVVTSTKSLKAQLRELQAQLANTEPDSAKYRELSKAAGELKDRIGDAAEAVGAQAGSAFERVGGSLGLVTGRLANLDFGGAAEGAKLLAENLGSIKFSDITNGIKSFGSTIGAVGKALLTNPIFLIGATLAVAISYASQFVAGLDGISEADQRNLEIQREKAALAKKQVDDISAQENILKQQGLTERQILNLKIKALETAILEQEVVVQTSKTQAEAQIAAAERNYKYLKGFLDFVTLPQRKITEFFITFYNNAVDLLNKIPGVTIDKVDLSKVTATFDDVNKFVAEKLFNPAETKKEADATVRAAEDALVSLKNQKAGIELQITQQDKSARDKRAADAKAAADKAAADRLKAEQEVSDLVNQLYEENLKEFEESEKKRTEIAEAEAEKRRKAEEDYNDAITALRAEQDARNLTDDQKEIIAIDNKYLTLKEKAIQAGQSTKEVEDAYRNELIAAEERAAERRIANERAVKDAKLQMTSDVLGTINSLVGAFAKRDEASQRRAFKIQKAISIAQATVDTYKGANAIFASAAANPATVLFPAQPFIAAGVAIGAGLANVATIAKQEFQGGTPPATNETPPPSITDGGGGSQPAAFNPFASSFLQDRPEQITPRAYVLAGDVASQQEVRTKVEDLSRIG